MRDDQKTKELDEEDGVTIVGSDSDTEDGLSNKGCKASTVKGVEVVDMLEVVDTVDTFNLVSEASEITVSGDGKGGSLGDFSGSISTSSSASSSSSPPPPPSSFSSSSSSPSSPLPVSFARGETVLVLYGEIWLEAVVDYIPATGYRVTYAVDGGKELIPFQDVPTTMKKKH